jgi:hypothetical protein
MTTPDFIALLVAALAKTIPTDTASSEAERAANLTMARTLFEAFQPADPLEAVQAAHAVAASLAALDSLARAARPGISDETAIRLRSSAIAAGRPFEALVRARRKQHQPQPARTTQRPRAVVPPANSVTSTARLPDRAELQMTGLTDAADAVLRAGKHPEWRSATALTSVHPTIPAPA